MLCGSTINYMEIYWNHISSTDMTRFALFPNSNSYHPLYKRDKYNKTSIQCTPGSQVYLNLKKIFFGQN